MSFNDLERGLGPAPSSSSASASTRRQGPGGGATNDALGPRRGELRDGGASVGRQSGSNAISRVRNVAGPLPLHHSPPSSSSAYHDDDDDGGGDVEANRTSGNAVPSSNAEFKKLAERIGIQLFKLNANVSAIDKLLSLPTPKSAAAAAGKGGAQSKGKDWTKQVADLSETTRNLVKTLTPDVRSLTTLHPPASLSVSERLTQQKLSRDFETALQAFAKAQRRSAERSRDQLEEQREKREELKKEREENRVAVEESSTSASTPLVDVEGSTTTDVSAAQEQLVEQIPSGPSLAEIEFQESLIAERESEIQGIEAGIQELNEIFRDLGTIVREQGGMIDNIEYNIGEIASNTGGAERELMQASEYQRKAGRRCAWLTLIVGGVVAVVLLALLS